MVTTSWRRRILVLAVVLVVGASPAAALEPNDFTGDIQAPQLTSFAIAPASADVTLADATFTATLRLTDDLSGVENVHVIWTNPAQTLSHTRRGHHLLWERGCRRMEGVVHRGALRPGGAVLAEWRLHRAKACRPLGA